MAALERLSLEPHINQESVYIAPKAVSAPYGIHHYHVFFVPGNPGCIAYYQAFLSQLSDCFSPTTSGGCRQPIHIFGQSLANFAEGTSLGQKTQGRILGLQEQISYTEEKLNLYVTSQRQKWMKQSTETQASGSIKIILIGHSVGAYICMELLKRWRMHTIEKGKSYAGWSRIVGFVGLFPTIIWIGKSPRGRTLGVSLAGYASTDADVYSCWQGSHISPSWLAL